MTKKYLYSLEQYIYDFLFIILIGIGSCIGYISRLGFYSDDWEFVGKFMSSSDQSTLGLFSLASTRNTMMRPMQNLYDVVMYLLFQDRPLGYHLVQMGMLIIISLLLYRVIRIFTQSRGISLLVPLVYLLLPNYSTDKFWFASAQSCLSVLLFCVSVLSSLNTGRYKKIWFAVSVICMILSIMSYEITIPFFFFLIGVYWKKSSLQNREKMKNILILLYVLMFSLVYKIATTTRLTAISFWSITHYPSYVIHLFFSVQKLHIGTLGIGLPWVLGRILWYSTPSIIITSILVGIAIALYTYRIIEKEGISLFTKMKPLVAIGFFICLFGYSIFITNPNVGFSELGIENRVAIMATIGVACLWIGSIGWLCKTKSSSLSRGLFSFLIGILCTSGVLITNTTAYFWTQSYTEQQRILTAVEKKFPFMPNNSVFILDGACAYIGPSVVFESYWDFRGALQTRYKDISFQADVVTPRMSVYPDGIQTQIYNMKTYYPYTTMYIYNMLTDQIYPIKNETDAKTYFARYNPDFRSGCQDGKEGKGIPLF